MELLGMNMDSIDLMLLCRYYPKKGCKERDEFGNRVYNYLR